MNISLESPGRLVIVLSHSELENLGLTYERLDYSREPSRAAIKKLLSTAAEKTGFDPKGGRLMIEVFPSPDMGCILCFSKPGRKRLRLSSDEERIYEFESCEEMMSAMKQLYVFGITGGSLFEKGGRYRLLLICRHPSVADRLLCEYSLPLGKDKHVSLYTKEHWQLLCASPAKKIGQPICLKSRK